MQDATFEEGAYAERPLRIAAVTQEDLQVASALIQDAVGLVGEISWMPKRRRLVLLVNRFRWEDETDEGAQAKGARRVRTALVFDDVLTVRGRGLDPRESDTVYALLAMQFDPGQDGTGTLTLQLAGDGDLALHVECIDMHLIDLTRPWAAKGAPSHGSDE